MLLVQVYPMKPEEFAAILIEKLEHVKHEQEAQEKLDRKLQEVCGFIWHTEDGSVASACDKMSCLFLLPFRHFKWTIARSKVKVLDTCHV